MNKYIRNVRSRDSGFFAKISQNVQRIKNKMKKHDPIPEDLTHDKIHIEEHKEPTFFKRVFNGKSQEQKEAIREEIREKPTEVKEEIQELREEYDTLNEVEHNVEKRKEGLFSKFKKLFKKKQSEEDENVPIEQVKAVIEGKHLSDVAEDKEEMHEMEEIAKKDHYTKEVNDIDEVKDDLKHMSKITLAILQHFPKEKQAQIKETQDFQEYKVLLEKYGFVK